MTENRRDPPFSNAKAMTAPIDRQHHNLTLAILAIGALAFALAQTTIIPALTAMQEAFDVGTSDIIWMVSAYFLAASIATPVLGRLGDMFGKERFLAVSLGAFAVGSVVCALSDGLTLMIVGRALQGIGGGVFPLSFGIVRDEFPIAKIPTGIAMLGATAGIGGAIGLPLGGLLVDQASYHWIFWISAAMGVIATITTIRFVPESPLRSPGKVDYARRRDPGRRPVGRADRRLARQRLGLDVGQDARAGRRSACSSSPRSWPSSAAMRAAGQHAHARRARPS